MRTDSHKYYYRVNKGNMYIKNAFNAVQWGLLDKVTFHAAHFIYVSCNIVLLHASVVVAGFTQLFHFKCKYCHRPQWIFIATTTNDTDFPDFTP